MTQPDSLTLARLNYDSENEHAQFAFSGYRGGKPFSLSGGLPVPAPGDLPESQVRDAVKRQLKRLLTDCADNL